MRFVICHLDWRMLGKIGGGRVKNAADAAIKRKLAAADRVDHDASGIRRVFNGKFEIELHRHIAEEPAFHANEADFVVELPRHVIARADVNILVREPFAHDRLHGLGLRGFFRGKPAPIKHVQEIGVAASIQLVGPLDFHATLAEKIDNRAMQNSRAHLRFDIVADDRQILVGKTLGPNRIARDENRNVIDESDSGFEGATGVEARRFLRADRQIIHHDLRAGILQFSDDLFPGRFLLQRQKCSQRILFAHVGGIAVENAPHFHDCASEVDLVAENFRAIGRRKYGFADIKSDLAPIDIECGHHFDVARPIRANLPMHQSHTGAISGGTMIKVYSLDERTGAVPHPDDGDSYFSHFLNY